MNLLNLPVELLEIIFKQLSLRNSLALSNTCRSLYAFNEESYLFLYNHYYDGFVFEWIEKAVKKKNIKGITKIAKN